ncbi:hypothetical protein [Histidinibacterium lentulum]|nr:hypothetical protein [Histidinibacterium lentulum]
MSELLLFLGQALIVAAVAAALIAGLALFFKWLPRMGPEKPGARVRGTPDLFGAESRYDVLMASGQRLAGLRFEGIVQVEGDGDWPLRQFALMRRSDGGKVILRVDSVRVFEELAPSAPGA